MVSLELPEVHESVPGVLHWSYYTGTTRRSRWLLFVGTSGFGSILLGTAMAGAVATGDPPAYVVAVLFCFLVAWIAVCGLTCFCSVTHEADASNREFRRNVYWAGKKVCTRTTRILDGDAIAIYYLRDFESSGSQHRVYLLRGGSHRLIGFFTSGERGPCSQLLAMFDRISNHLSIPLLGYRPFRMLVYSSLSNFRFRH